MGHQISRGNKLIFSKDEHDGQRAQGRVRVGCSLQTVRHLARPSPGHAEGHGDRARSRCGLRGLPPIVPAPPPMCSHGSPEGCSLRTLPRTCLFPRAPLRVGPALKTRTAAMSTGKHVAGESAPSAGSPRAPRETPRGGSPGSRVCAEDGHENGVGRADLHRGR